MVAGSGQRRRSGRRLLALLAGPCVPSPKPKAPPPTQPPLHPSSLPNPPILPFVPPCATDPSLSPPAPWLFARSGFASLPGVTEFPAIFGIARSLFSPLSFGPSLYHPRLRRRRRRAAPPPTTPTVLPSPGPPGRRRWKKPPRLRRNQFYLSTRAPFLDLLRRLACLRLLFLEAA